MRTLDVSKIPKPNFDFERFKVWRNQNTKFFIEIGCGVGRHPIQWAKNNPECQILAIERTSDKFEKFERRLTSHRTKFPTQYQNIWAAHAEAAVLLPHLKLSPLVDGIFYFYPNPEAKAKNRQLAESPLLPFLFEILKPGGRLLVASNVASYIDGLARVAIAIGFKPSVATQISSVGSPRTHFEKKYLERGDACFEIEMIKPQ